MGEGYFRIVIAIGFLTQIVGFIGFGYLLLQEITQSSHMLDQVILEIADTIKERDERMFKMNNRLLILEEQRDIERRVTDIEKAMRTYCLGSKIDMCGKLGPTK